MRFTEHCDDNPATCSGCAGIAKAAGGAELAEWLTLRATHECDTRFPKRFVGAVADVDAVVNWSSRFVLGPAECPSLLIAGPTGVGKTWQAYGALRLAVCTSRPASWEAVTFADFVAALRPSGKNPEASMAEYRGADLLLLDDLGAAKSSEWVEETTYRLLNHRYEAMLPSIFTTNLPLAQLRDGLGDRLASRLVEICERVVLSGDDRRRTPRPESTVRPGGEK